MASLWNGNGVVVRTDGTRSGEDVWQQALAADVDVNAADQDTHDQGLADSIERCLNLDGENTMAASLPMGGNRMTNLGVGTNKNHAMRVDQYQLGYNLYENATGGSANAQTITLSPSITAYTEGMAVRFTAGFTNTATAVTLNVDSVGAATVLNKLGNPPAVGSIVSGRTYVATYNGTNWIVDAAEMVLQAAVATTSGATVDITGIPSGARRITLFLDEVGGNGTNNLLLQLGDSGGVEPSGYEGGFGAITGTNTCNVSSSSDGRVIGTSVADDRFVGQITLTRISASSHRWMCAWQTMVLIGSFDTADDVRHGVFIKTLSAELDRLQLLWSGSDEFDAGSVSILVE